MIKDTENRLAQDKKGQTHELVLYKFDSCPYCWRVMSFLDKNPIPVTYKDTRKDPAALQELIRVGGKRQVPCLFIDGQPMYESLDIIRYLEKHYL